MLSRAKEKGENLEMTRATSLLEHVVRESVYIDVSSGYELGSDQAYVCYPCVFPTVRFHLIETALLCQIADSIRKEEGFKPLYDGSEEATGWYDIEIGINGYTESGLDTCITFELVNGNQPDTWHSYVIDLSEEEQRLIYARLNEECLGSFGKTCEELLEEAREEMCDGN